MRKKDVRNEGILDQLFRFEKTLQMSHLPQAHAE